MSITAEAVSSSSAHLECVPAAAIAAFGSTCGTEAVMVPCPLEPAGDEGLILSVISIIGDVEWSLFMGLPKTTATAVAAKFAGFDIPFDSPDMGDAIGELTNILAGQTKAMLDRRGVKAEIGLPSVMRADNLQVIAGKNTVTAKICFDSPLGRFWTGVLEKGKGLPV